MTIQENNTAPAMAFNPDDFELKTYRDAKGNIITKEESDRLDAEQAAAVAADGVTDVAFVEIKKDEKPAFNPAVFLTEALIAAGLNEAAIGWSIGIDPRVETAESEKDRIFFANRALRLFLAEIEGRDNITPRMLLADGIDSVKWIALMEQGVIPWLLNQFDSKGKRVVSEEQLHDAIPEDHKEDFTSNTGESDIASKINAAGDKPAEQWDPTGELITPRDELNGAPVRGETGIVHHIDESGFVEQPPVWQGNADQAPVVIGIDLASGPDQISIGTALVGEGEDAGCDIKAAGDAGEA